MTSTVCPIWSNSIHVKRIVILSHDGIPSNNNINYFCWCAAPGRPVLNCLNSMRSRMMKNCKCLTDYQRSFFLFITSQTLHIFSVNIECGDTACPSIGLLARSSHPIFVYVNSLSKEIITTTKLDAFRTLNISLWDLLSLKILILLLCR